MVIILVIIYYLHFIDELPNLVTALLSKVNNKILLYKNLWDTGQVYLGLQSQCLSNNGGEFAPKDFIDFCENLNIKTKTTAAESPWSNGICECHDAIITETLKVKEDRRPWHGLKVQKTL